MGALDGQQLLVIEGSRCTISAPIMLTLRHGTREALGWSCTGLGVTVVRLVPVLRHAQRTRSQAYFARGGGEEAAGVSVKVFMVFSQDKFCSVLRSRSSTTLAGLDRVQPRFVEQNLETPRVGV